MGDLPLSFIFCVLPPGVRPVFNCSSSERLSSPGRPRLDPFSPGNVEVCNQLTTVALSSQPLSGCIPTAEGSLATSKANRVGGGPAVGSWPLVASYPWLHSHGAVYRVLLSAAKRWGSLAILYVLDFEESRNFSSSASKFTWVSILLHPL